MADEYARRERAAMRAMLYDDLRAIFHASASEEDVAYVADKLWEKGWRKA